MSKTGRNSTFSTRESVVDTSLLCLTGDAREHVAGEGNQHATWAQQGG